MVVRTLLLTLASAATSVSCYRYVPAAPEVVPVGSEVRALLSTEGQVSMLNAVGLDARSIVGRLEASDGDALRFAVRAPFALARPGAPEEYVRFALVPRDVLRLELRRLDKAKTGAFAGALLAVTSAIVILAVRGEFSGGSQPPPGGQPVQ